MQLTALFQSWRRPVFALLAAFLLCLGASTAQAAELLFFDALDYPTAISADGQVLALVHCPYGCANEDTYSYRWTRSGGAVPLTGPFTDIYAADVSGDGSVIVGHGVNAQGKIEAWRWTEATGMLGMGALDPGYLKSMAWGVSSDGSVIAGESQGPTNFAEAWVWTEATGLVGLGDLTGEEPCLSEAFGISGNGLVVFGVSKYYNPEGYYDWSPFAWTEAGGMQYIAGLPGGEVSDAEWISSSSHDGAVMVGVGTTDEGEEVFRYSALTGSVGLSAPAGTYPGFYDSRGWDTDGLGDIAVGDGWYYTDPLTSKHRAFVWSEAGGMRRLDEVLVNEHQLNLQGYDLRSAVGISDYARVVIGIADNSHRGWVAILDKSVVLVPSPSVGCGLGIELVLILGAVWGFRRIRRSL